MQDPERVAAIETETVFGSGGQFIGEPREVAALLWLQRRDRGDPTPAVIRDELDRFPLWRPDTGVRPVANDFDADGETAMCRLESAGHCQRRSAGRGPEEFGVRTPYCRHVPFGSGF